MLIHQCGWCAYAWEADWKVSRNLSCQRALLRQQCDFQMLWMYVVPSPRWLTSSPIPDMAMSQALDLVSDLKLGWYTSIPPREMFACQILGTVIGAITNCTCSQTITQIPCSHLCRYHAHIGDNFQKALFGRNDPRSNRSMDRSITFHILLRGHYMGSSRTRQVLQREIYLVIYGFRPWRSRTSFGVLGT